MINRPNVLTGRFPMGMFTSGRYKKIIDAYCRASCQAAGVTDNSRLDKAAKLKTLAEIRKAFINPASGNDLTCFRSLGEMFASEKLDASLFLDLLDAYERDAAEKPVRIWNELLEYCRLSSGSAGRFMLALHNENPSTYLPAENLYIIMRLLNCLRDIKDRLSLLGRCYIPEDMLQKYGVRKSDMGLSRTPRRVQVMLRRILSKIESMQADVSVLPSLIRDFRLRWEVCVILSLTNSVIQKNKRADILQNPQSPEFYDWLKAVAAGLWRAMFVKTKRQGRVL